MPILVCN